ncbi:uncharacterized protein LOC134217022 [Armigeres subalbatus]|uniref:uncharacterized protein LOC134217022 n=1 Tax=Armigeres subalbatus TaxID=124917 RepID=UPI002ED1EECA
MKVRNISSFFLGCLIMQVVNAEACISFEEHKDEIVKCCKYEAPFPKDAVEGCVEDAKGKSGGDKHEFYSCLMECYLAKIGAVNGKSIDEGRMAELLQPLDETARNILLGAYKECAASTAGTKRAQCDSFALELEGCVLEKLDQQCPDEYYNPSEICDKLKAGAEICR